MTQVQKSIWDYMGLYTFIQFGMIHSVTICNLNAILLLLKLLPFRKLLHGAITLSQLRGGLTVQALFAHVHEETGNFPMTYILDVYIQ